MELKTYLQIIKRRIWILLASVLVITTCAAYYANSVSNPEYTAQTKFIVNPNQSMEVVNGKIDLGSIASSIQLIKTYKEIIRSPRIMEIVAQQHPELGLNAYQLISMVSVHSTQESQVVTIIVRDSSYQRAAVAVNAVAQVFQKEIPNIMKVDNVTILSTADTNEIVIAGPSNMAGAILIGLILSVMLGVGLIILLEFFDDSVRTVEDIQAAIGLATYARIPKVKKGGRSLGDGMDPAHNLARGERNVSVEA